MKQFRFLLIPLFAGMLFFVTSCGNNDETPATDTTTTDTTDTSTVAPEPVAVQEPVTMMIVKHKVSNYAKWKPSYDAHDSMRLANGVHSFLIGRGVPDSNMIMVAVKVDDVAKAKAFAKDASLKTAMRKGGVVGTPSISILTVPFLSSSDQSNLRSMTSNVVKDWDAWRTTFESHKQLRLDNGLNVRAYGHDVDDNHKVTIVTSIIDSAKAFAFMKSDALKQARLQSGVVGEPTRFIYRVVQTY